MPSAPSGIDRYTTPTPERDAEDDRRIKLFLAAQGKRRGEVLRAFQTRRHWAIGTLNEFVKVKLLVVKKGIYHAARETDRPGSPRGIRTVAGRNSRAARMRGEYAA